MKARCGGDDPEDFVKHIQYKFEKGIKCIIHITDAGAHGTKYSFDDRYPNQGTKLYSLISQCTKKINFQIINRDVNSFNFFKNIFERNGGKIYIIKTFDPNNDAGGYFTN